MMTHHVFHKSQTITWDYEMYKCFPPWTESGWQKEINWFRNQFGLGPVVTIADVKFNPSSANATPLSNNDHPQAIKVVECNGPGGTPATFWFSGAWFKPYGGTGYILDALDE